MIGMASPKVIISMQESFINKYSLSDVFGLLTFDLATISINKILKKNKSYKN